MAKFLHRFVPLLLVLIGSQGQATERDFPVPTLQGPVMDQAAVFSNQQAQNLEVLLRKVQLAGHMQLQILTLPSLQGHAIEEVTIAITDKWKLGQKGKDNGVLFLVVPSEKKARMEIGLGLEGDLPDVTAKRILADVCRPYFRAGQFGEGVLAGVAALVKITDPHLSLSVASPPAEDSTESTTGVNVGILIFVLVMLLLRLRFGSGWGGGGWTSGGGWSGGSGGGIGGGSGGWSGGGGGFGGGGSSDSW